MARAVYGGGKDKRVVLRTHDTLTASGICPSGSVAAWITWSRGLVNMRQNRVLQLDRDRQESSSLMVLWYRYEYRRERPVCQRRHACAGVLVA